MSITADQQTAVTQFAKSFVKLSESFGIPVGGKTVAPKPPATKPPATKKQKASQTYAAVDANTPAAVRQERKRLILAMIDAAGGTVSREDWLAIAGRYGYDSRRLGGFFAKKSGNGAGAGCLQMTADRKSVRLTEHGRSLI